MIPISPLSCRFSKRNHLLTFLTPLLNFIFIAAAFGQANGDYRSVASTAWNLAATWERFDGVMWQPNPTPPSSTDGVITIRSPHNVAANSGITADQVIVEVGATLTNSSTFTIANGAGDDLVVNGILTNTSIIQGDGSLIVNTDFSLEGTIQGNGALTVNGNTTWNSGTLDRAFTNQVGRTLNLGTSSSKNLHAPLVNDGTMTWTDGFFILNASFGSSFTNNTTFTMNGPLLQDNGGTGSFINNGTITKTSGGALALNNLNVTNPGTFNINAGSMSRSGGSFTNTGTFNLSTSSFVNGAGIFHHNTGSMILGTGSFSNSGTLQLNIDLVFPAAISFTTSGTVNGNGNLTVNNDITLDGFIEGNGSLTVNGNSTWNSGTLDRAFTNQAGRTFTIGTSSSKSLHAPFVNDGNINWTDGFIVLNAAAGSSFTNNSTFTMNGPLFQDNGGTGSFINNGTITKTSGVALALNNFIVTNSGTININAGSMSRANGSFTNTGTINLSTASFANGAGTFHHNTGSMILGTGSFSNGGILQLNIDLVFPAAISFTTSVTVNGNGNLTVNNNFTLDGIIEGNGSLTVNGNTTWNSGTLDRAFTNQAGRTLTIGTSSSKSLHAPLVNDGNMIWTDGFIVLNASLGSSFTNNSLFTMNGPLFQDNGGTGSFINNGTITKSSGGALALNNLNVSNSGTFNINAGSMSRSTGSFTNTGTINLSAASFANGAGTFLHNTGSIITGTGSFSNSGTLQLNTDLIFPATIPFSTSGTVNGNGNLTVNNDFTLDGFIVGNGSLTVNGNTTWNSGTLDRAFTNQAGRILSVGTSSSKSLHAPLVNDGTMNWTDGFIVPDASMGSSFTNNSIFTMNGPLFQDNGGTGSFINNGTITKSSGGALVLNNLNVTNSGTFNINAGSMSRSGGSFTNTGTINLSTTSFANGSGTFHYNTGSMITGTGSFSNSGTLQLNIDLIFPAAIPFSTSGTVNGNGNLTVNNAFSLEGFIGGNGSLTVNGNTTWNSGTLDRAFTNQAGRILTIGTSGTKTLLAPLVNDGTMTWSDGFIILDAAAGSSFTNNGVFTMNGPLIQDNGGTGTFINNGTITKSNTGAVSISNLNFTNSATGHIEGIGTYSFGTGTFTNNGFIAPGLSPGLLTINNKQLFSANTTLEIEVGSNNGPGTGHDQLASNMNPLTLNGTLTATLTGGFDPVPGTQYTVLTYPGRTGTFSSEPPCWIVTYNATNTMITYNPTFFDVCAADINLNTLSMQCSAVANYTISAMGTPTPTLTYSFAGATTGSGSGTGTGSVFNEGVTTVTILADNGCSSDTCSFTVTITDVESPIVICPANITQNNDPGLCSAIVTYDATASDNCAIASITYTPASGSAFPEGTTMVTATATDVNGNTSSCTFQVTVNDTENPTIECPDNIIVSNEPGLCGAVVNFSITSDDNCTGEVLSQTGGLASGSTFPVGITTNIFLVTDASGNTATCSFTVTVNDIALPTIVCPANITINNDPGVCGAVFAYVVSTDDNCTGEVLSQTGGLASGSKYQNQQQPLDFADRAGNAAEFFLFEGGTGARALVDGSHFVLPFQILQCVNMTFIMRPVIA